MAKRVTIRQIAEELGVSLMTVSRALNNSKHVDETTRNKVKETANKLGYVPNYIARSLVSQKTYTIGVVVPDIAHQFFAEAVKGIEMVSWNQGYQMMLTHSAEDTEHEVTAIETLASKRVDGLLISVVETGSNLSVFQQVKDWKIPLVFFDRSIQKMNCSVVRVDDESCSYKMTKHLIDLGYQRLAHLRGPLSVSIAHHRFNGFKRALKEHHLEYIPELVVESGLSEEGGYNAMKQILKDFPKNDYPDAILCINDSSALGTMFAIQDAGLRIPDDIAVVGFYNDSRARLMPSPFTTVDQNAFEIGEKAARKLIAHIEDEEEKVEEIIVESDIIIRESCGASRKNKK